MLAGDLPQGKVTDRGEDVVVERCPVRLVRVNGSGVLAEPRFRVISERDIPELRVNEDVGSLIMLDFGYVVAGLAPGDERSLPLPSVMPVAHRLRLAGYLFALAMCDGVRGAK